MPVRRKTAWMHCATPPPPRTTKAMARFGSSLSQPALPAAAAAALPLETLSKSASRGCTQRPVQGDVTFELVNEMGQYLWSAVESYAWSPSHDQCGMLRPFGTSSADR